MRGRRRGEGSPPYGEVASSAVGRADRGVRPYGAIRGVVRDRVGGRKGHPYENVIRGAVQDRRATARVAPTEGYMKCGGAGRHGVVRPYENVL